MCSETRSSSRHNHPKSVLTMKARQSHEGWYGPEILNELQQLYDDFWRKLQKDVFPWDVEAARERLAVLVFELDDAFTHPALHSAVDSNHRPRPRVYDSAAIDIIGWARDEAFEHLSVECKKRPNTRLKLALCIAQFFDEGESNPLQLSRMAVAINMFSERKRMGRGRIAFDTIQSPITAEGPIAF
jgi:hypothetical protein